MLKVIEKNILDVEEGIICHQVNCQGAMASGIAKDIRAKWPKVYEAYKYYCDRVNPPKARLGQCQPIFVSDGLKLSVINIYGQLDYGREPHRIYTDYWGVDRAFESLKHFVYAMKANNRAHQVYIPYMMGCGLAHGNWEKYSAIIEKYIPEAIVCKFPGVK